MSGWSALQSLASGEEPHGCRPHGRLGLWGGGGPFKGLDGTQKVSGAPSQVWTGPRRSLGGAFTGLDGTQKVSGGRLHRSGGDPEGLWGAPSQVWTGPRRSLGGAFTGLDRTQKVSGGRLHRSKRGPTCWGPADPISAAHSDSSGDNGPRPRAAISATGGAVGTHG
ncbi:unnamed protein product [Boreogadus saida]